MILVSLDLVIFRWYFFQIDINTPSQIYLDIRICSYLCGMTHSRCGIKDLIDEVIVAVCASIRREAVRFQVLSDFCGTQQKIILHELVNGDPGRYVGSF